MALQIDWVGGLATPPYKALVTIPQADLIFVSGAFYQLDTMAFWNELKALEATEIGIVFGDLQVHNEDYTVGGTNYADAVLMQCQVKFEDTGSAYSVGLINSNNDIWDVEGGILIPTPLVTVIAGNSAGLVIIVSTDTATIEAKVDTLITAQDLTNIQKEAEHTTQVSVAPLSQAGTIILRNTTESRRWEADAWEDAGQTIGYRGKGLESVGMLVEVAWL